ncbi:MAG TPA: Jag N-terminal domain-containing protein, partial [Spirochaetales bacterium]|nr:Jag N-terminal domain-containing protein [Spirochaetales bacterium]
MEARIGFDAVRELMRRYLDEDGDKRAIVAEGATLEEALRSASVQLDCPVARLEYDILERGAQGFVGLGRKKWKLSVYEAAVKQKVEESSIESFDGGLDLPIELKPIQQDVDGQVY